MSMSQNGAYTGVDDIRWLRYMKAPVCAGHREGAFRCLVLLELCGLIVVG